MQYFFFSMESDGDCTTMPPPYPIVVLSDFNRSDNIRWFCMNVSLKLL